MSACTMNWSMWLPTPQTTTLVALRGDAQRGQDIFQNGLGEAPPCSSCHALTSGGFSLGPTMQGISQRAGSRIEGMDAEAYLRQSILEPEAFIVQGYRSLMFPSYARHFDEQDILDLIAYLETL
jgi:cytochrome c2